MSDLATRVAVLGLIALLVVWEIWRRRRVTIVRPQEVTRPDLGAGVHLFASATCHTCEPARRALVEVYGKDFREVVYEKDPALFAAAGIRSVPSIFVLGPGGMGLLWEGVPRRSDLPGRPTG